VRIDLRLRPPLPTPSSLGEGLAGVVGASIEHVIVNGDASPLFSAFVLAAPAGSATVQQMQQRIAQLSLEQLEAGLHVKLEARPAARPFVLFSDAPPPHSSPASPPLPPPLREPKESADCNDIDNMGLRKVLEPLCEAGRAFLGPNASSPFFHACSQVHLVSCPLLRLQPEMCASICEIHRGACCRTCDCSKWTPRPHPHREWIKVENPPFRPPHWALPLLISSSGLGFALLIVTCIATHLATSRLESFCDGPATTSRDQDELLERKPNSLSRFMKRGSHRGWNVVGQTSGVQCFVEEGANVGTEMMCGNDQSISPVGEGMAPLME